MTPLPSERLFSFVAGDRGAWRVTASSAVRGPGLGESGYLDVRPGGISEVPGSAWVLRGIVSNERYLTHAEKVRLVSIQPSLGQPEATCAALIPIRKTQEWWALPQDRRREIFEERSSHIALGHEYLPAIARRLYHCHDLGEPFDFLTWFEFRPEDAGRFAELVSRLRRTEEWNYVDREVEIRLQR